MLNIYIIKKAKRTEFLADENITILDLARKNKIDIEGSCDGSMACSTCHIKIEKKWHDKLPPPCIDEKEMLILLDNYSDKSRLGCQIKLTKNLDGLEFTVPEEN